MDKKLERSNADKVLRRLTNQIKSLGFVRTKPTFWIRECEHLVHFIHIHKFTFGPYFRIHTCIRVLNSSLDGIALFGPTEKELVEDLQFNYSESPESIENCVNYMKAFISCYSEKWYQNSGNLDALLSSHSVIDEQDKIALKQAIDGEAVASNIKRSRLLLKIA